jgi:hypothetical protein
MFPADADVAAFMEREGDRAALARYADLTEQELADRILAAL